MEQYRTTPSGQVPSLGMLCRGVPQPAAAARQLRSGGGDLAAALHPAAHAGLGARAFPGRLPGGPLWQPLGAGGQVQGQVRDLQVGAPADLPFKMLADTCASAVSLLPEYVLRIEIVECYQCNPEGGAFTVLPGGKVVECCEAEILGCVLVAYRSSKLDRNKRESRCMQGYRSNSTHR